MTREGEASGGRVAARPRTDEVTHRDASGGSSEDPAVARARRVLAARSRAVRDEQLERALSEADLTPEQRAELEALADRLVERLLARPRATLRTAPDRDRVATTVLELFD